MTSYKIRITTELLEVSNEEVIKWFKDNKHISRYYLVVETGKKTKKEHIQGWIELHPGVKKLNMRQYIRRYTEKTRISNEYSGNTLYSFTQNKELYPVEYLCYLMKEDTNPVTNLEVEHLKQAQERNIKEFNKIKKKETINQVIENVENQIREDMEKDNTILHNLESYICRKVIEYHRETNRRYVENQAVSIVQTINLKLNPGDTNLINRLQDRAFRSPLL